MQPNDLSAQMPNRPICDTLNAFACAKILFKNPIFHERKEPCIPIP